MQAIPSIVFWTRGFHQVVPVLQAGHTVIASSGPRHHERPSVGAGLHEGVRIEIKRSEWIFTAKENGHETAY